MPDCKFSISYGMVNSLCQSVTTYVSYPYKLKRRSSNSEFREIFIHKPLFIIETVTKFAMINVLLSTKGGNMPDLGLIIGLIIIGGLSAYLGTLDLGLP